MTTLRTRIAGLGACLLIALMLLGAPAVLIGIGAAPWHLDFSSAASLLSAPDDGWLAMGLIAVVAWVAWLVIAVSLILDIAARTRGIRAPRIPGLALPQIAAGRLVGIASLLFVAVPALTPLVTPEPAGAAPAPVSASLPVLPSSPTEAPRAAEPDPPATTDSTSTSDYTVKRGDTLWKIAEQHLGDGLRYTEIVELNHDVLGGRPDFIQPGTVLQLPAVDADTYVVQPGDTLSGIAAARLGEPDRYPEIFEASRATVQPDGARLTDPDLIRPGWRLTIPASSPTNGSRADTSNAPAHQPERQSETPDPATPSEVPATGAPTDEPTETEVAGVAADSEAGGEAPAWLLPGLAGAGGLLAGSLLLALRSRRRTRNRHRIPGHVLAPTPPELRPVEKTATITGGATASAIPRLDRLLRHLAANLDGVPPLEAAELDGQSVTLQVAEPADLPAPWEGKGMTWSAELDMEFEDVDEIPPYPLLVSVGQDDSGRLSLIDLERFGTLAITGDPERAEAFARHIAAELALNPWSILARTDLLGIGGELAALDPLRLTHHELGDQDFLVTLKNELDATQRSGAGDPDPFHVVIATEAASEYDGVTAIADLIHGQTVRSGAALVMVGITPHHGDTAIEVDADGRVRLPDTDKTVVTAGLSSEEAAACAAIVDLTEQSEVVPTPSSETATGWRALADDAGALRPAYTEPRPPGPAGKDSLLPDSADAYEASAATTAEDVETLAPVVNEELRAEVEEADPTLDDDLAEWHNPDSKFPKLTVLGPVTSTAHGETRQIIERRSYFTELLAFIALHPDGVSSAAVSEAFSISTSRARTDIGFLRTWLGTNPRTGRPHLPAANASRVCEETGVPGYQVDDVLIDFDLFRRLRARGEARGAAGIADLEAALELVTGEPFTHLRERGWSWLLDEERLHETATCAIVDTAHTVVTDALERGDVDRASTAAGTAHFAAPLDEVALVDLSAVLHTQGHHEVAEEMHLDRTRDYDQMPEPDLPKRGIRANLYATQRKVDCRP